MKDNGGITDQVSNEENKEKCADDSQNQISMSSLSNISNFNIEDKPKFLTPEKEMQLRNKFAEIDVNKKGTISPQKATSILSVLLKEWHPSKILIQAMSSH